MLLLFSIIVIIIPMSILQEYERHKKILGEDKIVAIDEYLAELKEKNINKHYSDIIYKKEEFEKFEI